MGDGAEAVPYDEIGAHEPPVHHIAQYLGWLARSGLLDESRFDAELLRSVRAAERTGLDLLPVVGDALTGDVMTSEGRRFSDFYYDRYLAEYDELAAGGVVPARAAVEELIDARYGQWVARGRPAAKPRAASTGPDASPAASGGTEVTPRSEARPAASATFRGSTWAQVEQQKAELARTLYLAFKDDPSATSAYPDETTDDGPVAEPDATPEEESRPRWKFWR